MGLRKRFIAATYDRLNAGSEKHSRPYREQTAGQTTGEVLEIGAGTGANLSFYPPSVRLTVVEPNPHMAARLRKKARAVGMQVRVEIVRGEELPFADGAFDCVVSTLVLCSVRDLSVSLAEARRVLRPGGAFYFFEHVGAGGWRRRAQDLLNPVYHLVDGECNLNRDIDAAIRSAGFSQVDVRAFDLPGSLPVFAAGIVGTASA